MRRYEELGSITWLADLEGPAPRVNHRRSFFHGRMLYSKQRAEAYAFKRLKPPEPSKVYEYRFDVNEIRGPIIAVVEESGWEWVPVTAKRHATFTQA